MTPQQKSAKALMERRFEYIGARYLTAADDQLQLLQERKEMEELWRLAGFGDPPEFRPSLHRMAAAG